MSQDTDLLWGYAAIGEFLGLTAQAVKHRSRRGQLPIFKQGRTPCATKSGLRAYMAKQMSQAEAAAKGGR